MQPPGPDAPTIDTLAGVSFPDPQRWLEGTGEDVRLWQKEQATRAQDHVLEMPGYPVIAPLVAELTSERFGAVPRLAGGRWFRSFIAADSPQAQAVVADAPYGEPRVLWDPATEAADHPPYLSWLSPSPDGRTLAIGVCTDGSENNTIRLINVASGRALPDPPTQVLMDNWRGGAQWLPDSSGFFFTALTGISTSASYATYLHRGGRTERIDIPWLTQDDYKGVFVSRDGRWAVASERLAATIPVAYASLDDLVWHPFVTTVEGTLAGHAVGDAFIGVTDVGSPRGRLVRIPFDSPTPNDPTTWEDLIPASDAVLRGVTPVGDELYVTELVDTYTRVRIVGLDGSDRGEVPLPGRGTVAELPFPIMTLAPRGDADSYLFAFSSLLESWSVHQHTGGERVELRRATQRIDATVEDCWATSRDGTRIPYHVVRPPTGGDGPRPTLLYAYGAWNVPWSPQYPSAMAAFVAAGGTFVHAHLRGGGEFGSDWGAAGRLGNKHNCLSDLYAVADQLVADGVTTAPQLAVTGGSAGGWLAGMAVTERPELWAAVVPRAPILDLIGACRESYGYYAVSAEFGDPTDPDEVRRLAGLSPYHLATDGTTYPAVLLDAGDTDPRCPPWHARKLGARLQQAQAGDAPILVHVWDGVGHGWATDKQTAQAQNTEWLTFVAHHTGLLR